MSTYPLGEQETVRYFYISWAAIQVHTFISSHCTNEKQKKILSMLAVKLTIQLIEKNHNIHYNNIRIP